jgi:hypothetical protein
MGSNIALRRAAKALRRKAIVAQKRKAEQLATSLPERVRRAATTPIQHCLLNAKLFDNGMGTLMLARGTSRTGQLAVASFLIDALCLGVKDVMFRSIGADEFADYVAMAGLVEPLKPVDPRHARKFLRELVGWSRAIGFSPHPEFAAVEPIFGDVNADACDRVFQFGRDGKPFYIPSESETPAQVSLRLKQLRSRLGEDGFGIEIAA